MDKNMLTALVNRKERAKVKVKRKHAPSSHSSTSSKPKLTKKPKQRWVYLRITLKSKNFVFKNFPLQTPCKDSTQGSILPGWVVRHKRTIIKATRDFKAFYGFKASAWYKALESRITSQLSLPLCTHQGIIIMNRNRTFYKGTWVSKVIAETKVDARVEQ